MAAKVLLLLVLLVAAAAASPLRLRRQDGLCDMCRQVEARTHALMNSNPSQVSAVDMCGGELTEACGAFLVTYGRTIVSRAYYGQTNICEKLASQEAFFHGVVAPLCAAKPETDDNAVTVQTQTPVAPVADAAVEPAAVTSPDVAPQPAPCTSAALTPLHTYIRVLVAMRQQSSSKAASDSNVADAVIQRTDFLTNGDMWRATQDVHLTLNNQGQVTSMQRVVNMQQLNRQPVDGASAQAAGVDSADKSITNPGAVPSRDFDQATVAHAVAIFVAMIAISALVLTLSSSSEENASEDEDVDALIEVMSQTPATMSKMSAFVPTMPAAPLAKEKEPLDF